MKKKYTVEHENGITTVRFSEKPTFEEVQGVIDDLVENYPYDLRVWDLSNIDFNFSEQEIIDIANYGKLKFVKPNKAAFIAPQDLVYGQLRAFEVYREQEHAAARVFRTKPEALAWLEKQR